MAVLFCSHCQKHKPAEEFHVCTARKSGRQTRCKICVSESNGISYKASAKRRNTIRTSNRVMRAAARDLVDSWLRVHPCVDCGESDPIVLEFDHVRGKKRTSIAVMRRDGFAAATIQAEIEKCEVRCANCHRRKTARERGWKK